MSGAWRNNSNLSDNFDRSSPVDIPPPKDIPLAPSRTSQNDRTVILSNTRNIAALAAKKRNKAQSNMMNFDRQMPGEPRTLYRPSSDRSNNDRDAYLTPSRLDKHNKIFVADNVFPMSNAPSEDSLSTITKHTAISDHSLPPLRRVSEKGPDRYNGNMRQWVPVDPGKRRKKRTETSYSQQVNTLLTLTP